MTNKQEDGFNYQPDHPLNQAEIDGIIIGVRSVFTKLSNLYQEVSPIFNKYGFKPPSTGVVARDLSEKIETSIIQHCQTFEKGQGHSDLSRHKHRWEVKICKRSGLTINQSSIIQGENYLVINYNDLNEVLKIWVLWQAKDGFFSPRSRKSNARSARLSSSGSNVQYIYRNGVNSLALQPQKSKQAGVKKKAQKRAN